jgi:signal transduction histidine kinase
MKTDFQRLHQILENLLNNACKFTSQGTITLKASHEKDTSGDWMRFIVSDTGIGIGSEQVHKLFLAFSQLDENLIQPTDGTGLGLAVSRQIARMMGGDITVVSQLGKGSTFTVRIPCELPLG